MPKLTPYNAFDTTPFTPEQVERVVNPADGESTTEAMHAIMHLTFRNYGNVSQSPDHLKNGYGDCVSVAAYAFKLAHAAGLKATVINNFYHLGLALNDGSSETYIEAGPVYDPRHQRLKPEIVINSGQGWPGLIAHEQVKAGIDSAKLKKPAKGKIAVAYRVPGGGILDEVDSCADIIMSAEQRPSLIVAQGNTAGLSLNALINFLILKHDVNVTKEELIAYAQDNKQFLPRVPAED